MSMNGIGSLLGGLGQGAILGYMANGQQNPFSGLFGNKAPGAASPDLGGGVPSTGLGGILPGATVPLSTGINAGGSQFGGVGQGLTNATAGLFQNGGNMMVGGNAPGGINPLALALMMGRR